MSFIKDENCYLKLKTNLRLLHSTSPCKFQRFDTSFKKYLSLETDFVKLGPPSIQY